MRSPLESGPFEVVHEVDSTQNECARRLRGELATPIPGVLLARTQTAGRGRFGRPWVSRPGVSLTMSLVLRPYAGHRQPWLVGMGCAIAVARACRASLQWPNDVVWQGRKLGGVLTEIITDGSGLPVPIVGVGVNLAGGGWPPELEASAAALQEIEGRLVDAVNLADEILRHLEAAPEPDRWDGLRAAWMELDQTPGKRFRLPDGRVGIAVGVGTDGELECNVDGVQTRVYAAEALAVAEQLAATER